MPTYIAGAKWLNENQGVVAVCIFATALLFGWVSGIFSALRRRPKLRARLIDGPTFTCTFTTGAKHGEYDVHRTGVALYLQIANVGSAASSIERVSIGYHWQVRRFTKAWLRYGVGWFWLHDQTAAMHDFQAKIWETRRSIPFSHRKAFLLRPQRQPISNLEGLRTASSISSNWTVGAVASRP